MSNQSLFVLITRYRESDWNQEWTDFWQFDNNTNVVFIGSGIVRQLPYSELPETPSKMLEQLGVPLAQIDICFARGNSSTDNSETLHRLANLLIDRKKLVFVHTGVGFTLNQVVKNFGTQTTDLLIEPIEYELTDTPPLVMKNFRDMFEKINVEPGVDPVHYISNREALKKHLLRPNALHRIARIIHALSDNLNSLGILISKACESKDQQVRLRLIAEYLKEADWFDGMLSCLRMSVGGPVVVGINEQKLVKVRDSVYQVLLDLESELSFKLLNDSKSEILPFLSQLLESVGLKAEWNSSSVKFLPNNVSKAETIFSRLDEIRAAGGILSDDEQRDKLVFDYRNWWINVPENLQKMRSCLLSRFEGQFNE